MKHMDQFKTKEEAFEHLDDCKEASADVFIEVAEEWDKQKNRRVKLNPRQRFALKYIRAFGALCAHHSEWAYIVNHLPEADREYMVHMRDKLHMMYLQFDPDCTFDTSLEYDDNGVSK